MANLYITENGAQFIATNTDRIDGGDRLRPSGGALSAAIQFASQAKMQPIGKPYPECFHLLKE
jgi:ribonucleotide monophosphatase NagD (HAD superfamily)